MKKTLIYGLLATLLIGFAAAQTVTVGQFGYHPDSHKQVVVYGGYAGERVDLVRVADGVAVDVFTLAKATNYEGDQTVECQGGQPCVIADFSAFSAPGEYVFVYGAERSPPFVIGDAVYADRVPTLLEFFDATLQQGSSYHGDLHGAHDPVFPVMADGSFLLEADQASAAAIRMGAAYRENPELFSVDRRDIIAADAPDLAEYLTVHAEYLSALQGLEVSERSDGVGFRTGTGMEIVNAFTPGPAHVSETRVYYSNQGGSSQTVPVTSLCGADHGSSSWDACMADAAAQYKCQAGEVCLNLSYIGTTGEVTGAGAHFDVMTGWSYEFQCYPDVPLSGGFNDQEDTCLIFKDDTSRAQTVQAMHGMLQALPAVEAVSHERAQQIFKRAYETRDYVQSAYPGFSGADEDIGHWGAALFLLYDHSGEERFLREAHALREDMPTGLVSEHTPGNEFYWEEYARHEDAIRAAGLEYPVNGQTPGQLFRGKIYFDYKDDWQAMDQRAERVFEFVHGAGDFQRSRQMLVEGVLASKAMEFYDTPESFIPVVQDQQLAWLTGQNRVQDGLSATSGMRSLSFINGIGNDADSQHTRLLLDTGLYDATGGAIAGVRSSQFFFEDGGRYWEYDGVSNILGTRYGSAGNQWNGESYNDPFDTDRTYANGKSRIDGWISGAYDVPSETDVILNFDDDVDAWRFTETTSEIVGTALEYVAYLDAQRNNRPRVEATVYDPSAISITWRDGSVTPPSDENTTDTTGGSCAYSVKDLAATCDGGSITSDEYNGCRVVTCEGGTGVLDVMACDKPGSHDAEYYEVYRQDAVGSGVELCIGDACLSTAPYDGYARGPDFPVCTDSSTGGGSTDNTSDGSTGDNTTDGSTGTGGSADACYDSVQYIPVSCTGTIDSDTWNGCRQVACSDAAGSIQALACDKDDRFEVYRQGETGTPPEVCFGDTCLQDRGYADGVLPYCTSEQQCSAVLTYALNPDTGTCEEFPSPCDVPAGWESCEPGTTAGVSLAVAEWYPKGLDVVYECDASFAADTYDWRFGDGDSWIGSTRSDVYHTYPASGTYDATCTASGDSMEGTGMVTVTVRS